VFVKFAISCAWPVTALYTVPRYKIAVMPRDVDAVRPMGILFEHKHGPITEKQDRRFRAGPSLN
jgi:hypothetical protein